MSIQLGTIGIVVKDMKESLAFYELLGVPKVDDITEDNVDVTLPNGITLGFLTLNMAKQADPEYREAVGQNMNLQFECDLPETVDRVYASVIEHGYKSYAEPWDAVWGQRFARVIDPDGRIVNLYASLA